MRHPCTVPGCPRYAAPGAAVCPAHKRTPPPAAQDAAAADPLALFEAAVAGGSYAGLFGEKLRAVLADAAAQGSVDNEIGVLRYTLARVIAEERDPGRLAAAVARISAVIVQAMRAKRQISGELAEGITDAVAVILEELKA